VSLAVAAPRAAAATDPASAADADALRIDAALARGVNAAANDEVLTPTVDTRMMTRGDAYTLRPGKRTCCATQVFYPCASPSPSPSCRSVA
jgi:hypothetical protein